MQLQQQLKTTQEELDKSQNTNNQAQNAEKELQARLSNEQEERERLQLQLHQMKKQVRIYAFRSLTKKHELFNSQKSGKR